MELTSMDTLPVFDGNALISVADDPAYVTDGALTLECWCYVLNTATSCDLIRKSVDGQIVYRLALEALPHALELYATVAGAEVLRIDVTGLQNRWLPIALAFSPVGNVTQLVLYLNGEKQEEATWPETVTDGVGTLELGRDFQGYLTQLRRWDRRRSAPEVLTGQSHALMPQERGLVSWYALENGYLKDRIGGREGQAALVTWQELDRPVTFERDPVLLLDEKSEKIAVSFDEGEFPDSRWTIECWVNSFHATPAGTLCYYAEVVGDDPVLAMSDLSSLTIRVRDESWRTGINLTDGNWHHLAVTFHVSSGLMNVFVDGERISEDGNPPTFSRSIAIPSKGIFWIGQSPQDNEETPLRTSLSDFRVWKTVRTGDEIRNNFLYRLDGSEYALALYLSLCQAAGNQIEDGSVRGRMALLTGGRWQTSDLFLAAAPLAQLQGLRTLAWTDDGDSGGGPTTPGDGGGNPSNPGNGGGNGGIPSNDPVKVEDLLQQLAEGVSLAREKMTNDPELGERLSEVRMNLNVLPGTIPGEVILPDASLLRYLQPGQLSSISFSFAPTVRPEPAPTLPKVPKVTGYTRQHALSQLTAAGLEGECIYQSTGQANEKGVVLEQVPGAGATLSPKMNVVLIIGE